MQIKGYDVGIVVLNYMNYRDTIICVKSILKIYGGNADIVIVDNGSANNSVEILEHCFYLDDNVSVISLEENTGFARGNNVGIKKLRESGCEFVLLLNSDTVFVDDEYIEKMLNNYQPNVGVIEANVWDRRGLYVQPQYFCPTLHNAIIALVNAIAEYNFLNVGAKYVTKKSNNYLYQVGCSIMLTPSYFMHYGGLYSKTFLYGEEIILLYLLKKAKLCVSYCDDTYIVHNEGGSTPKDSLEGTRKKKYAVIRGYFNVLKASLMTYNRYVKLAGK